MLGDALRKLAKHSAIYGVAEQVGRVSALVLMPVHTDYMPANEYGLWELLGPSIAVLTHLLGINMYNAMTRYYFERAAGPERNEIVSTTVWSVLMSGGLFGLLLYLFSDRVVAVFATDYPGMTLLFELSIGVLVLQMVKEVLFKYLQAEHRSVTYGVIRIGKLLVEIALQLTFLIGYGMGVESIFVAMLIGEALATVVLLVMVVPKVGLRFSGATFMLLAAFTLPLIPNGLLQWMLHNADRFMLQWMQGEQAVGIYGPAYKLGSIPNYLIMSPFLLIWYPYVFGLGSLDTQRDLVGRLMPYFMLVMTAVVLGVAMVADELALYFIKDPTYAGASSAIPWVCAGYWFWGLFQILQTGFYVQKRTGVLPQLTLFAAVLNVGTNLVMIPRFGFLGAAAATTVTFAALCVVCAWRVRGVFDVEWPWRRCATPALGAGLAYVVTRLVPLEVGIVSGLARFGVWLVWAACLWVAYLSDDERDAARDLLRDGLGRVRSIVGGSGDA